MDTGMCGGLPLQHLREEFPSVFNNWLHSSDRVHHRIPGGESLADVMLRLSPLVIDVERHVEPVLLVAHLSTLQLLIAYFMGIPLSECVKIRVPQHTVFELEPSQYGWRSKLYHLDPAHLLKPGVASRVVIESATESEEDPSAPSTVVPEDARSPFRGSHAMQPRFLSWKDVVKRDAPAREELLRLSNGMRAPVVDWVPEGISHY
jgi:broad specificity phosphatase PhoE